MCVCVHVCAALGRDGGGPSTRHAHLLVRQVSSSCTCGAEPRLLSGIQPLTQAALVATATTQTKTCGFSSAGVRVIVRARARWGCNHVQVMVPE